MAEKVENALREYLEQAGRLRPVQLGGDESGEVPAPPGVDPEGEALFLHFQQQLRSHNTLLWLLTGMLSILFLLGTLIAIRSLHAPQIAASVVVATLISLLVVVTILRRVWTEKVTMDLTAYALSHLSPQETVRVIEVIYWNRVRQGSETSPAPRRIEAVKYDDFIVRIRPDRGDGVVLEVSSPAGETEEVLHLPPEVVRDAEQLTGRLGRCSALERSGKLRHLLPEARAARADAGQLGTSLFNALFPEEARTLYERCVGRTGLVSRRGLRIRLAVNPGHRQLAGLSALPWELLCSSGTFLGRQRLTPIVRVLEVPRPPEPAELAAPLRILMLISTPTGLASLDVEQERRHIEAIRGRQPSVEIVCLRRPSPEELRERLCDEEFHVLHFMGHGGLDPDSGEGVLYFEGEEGESRPVSGQVLAEEVEGFHALRLAVINACHSGHTRQHDGGVLNPFAGVAASLVQAGLTSVVAMQFAISDGAAIDFSRALYHRLAAGDPVDAAVTEGRRVLARRDGESLEWATPVLFLRAGEGRVFDVAE